jgi:hypothetical protein
MVADAVSAFSPLTILILASHGPMGNSRRTTKVTGMDWPGASVTIRCKLSGPALVPPGPFQSRTVPDKSTARPPVLSTWAVRNC